ncbi:hypothetical protein Pla110_39280 [Polystyrenella longa]|uniref:DNA-directed RNA polymerase subunit P n=1 Tax=Polystyrenella longa TaxID=2528007 RepID=A0A518CSH3_9PLAN|nr:hypothetical protein [Polystyrenella longa]QDU82173.1 hypothetical protein Pla110_39280 [Polystyrenella longa]
MNSPEIPEYDEPIFPPEATGRTEVAGQSIDEGKGRIFPCEGCGADLKFNIGQQELICPFCGYSKQLVWDDDETIAEQDYASMLDQLATWKLEGEETPEDEHAGEQEIHCESCGAYVIFVGSLTSTSCPYCSSPLQREDGHKAPKRIPVDGMLPFLVTRQKTEQNLKQWVSSLWFAPNDFRKQGIKGNFEGVYLPYWTFDSMTFTRYSGERGDHYNVTTGSGKNRQTVRRTRWSHASGSFQRFFDDTLILAAREMNLSLVQQLEPWPLHQCVPFRQELLAGLFSRTYEVELDEGFVAAQSLVRARLKADVENRIGGDTQRVHDMDVVHDAITFKHLLLPVWLMPYKYKGELYQLMVNAATGEVTGERPYSWVKIASSILAGLLVVGAVLLLSQR